MFSQFIIGTMRWGIWGADLKPSGVIKIINSSLENGFYTFDCADIYGDYTTEKLFGEALSEMSIDRNKIQIISKCGIQMPCSNKDYRIKSYNYTPKHILQSVDNSLKNLQTEYLDVLLLHRPSPLMKPDEIAETFQKLQSAGKVREFGVSNFSTRQFDTIDAQFALITNQIEFSLSEPKALYDGTLDQMTQKKLQPMAWSPLGNYFTSASEKKIRIQKVVTKLCEKYSCLEDQLLLAYILKHPAGILPVLGTSKITHIENAKNALSINLEIEDWFHLLEASTGKEVD